MAVCVCVLCDSADEDGSLQYRDIQADLLQ